MMQIIQLKGKDKHLYRLLAPLVMDPEVIRANNNYPFKTGEEYVWFIAIEDKEVLGFVPVEQKGRKNGRSFCRCCYRLLLLNSDLRLGYLTLSR